MSLDFQRYDFSSQRSDSTESHEPNAECFSGFQYQLREVLTCRTRLALTSAVTRYCFDQGLTTRMPQSSKSAVLRVAMWAPWRRATAAIIPSN
jgi:hypothetical protein